MSDAVVVGAGLAGLTAALRLAERGRSVTLLSAGVGGLGLSQGTIDVLGYTPERVGDPLPAIDALIAREPAHPYAPIGSAGVRSAIQWFAELVGATMLTGNLESNLQLPTAVGAIRPTALAPPSMCAGHLGSSTKLAIVGFCQLKDFQATLIAANLARTPLPGGGMVGARALQLDLAPRDGEADGSGLAYARAMDDATFRRRFVAALAPQLADGEVVGVPAVLGLVDAHAAWSDVADQLGRPVFEIPLPPPSVPGIRLNNALTKLAIDRGVRVVMGGRVVGAERSVDRITAVHTDTAGRRRSTDTPWVVFAPGGFESGALAVDSYGTVSEPVFGLPLTGVPSGPLVDADYWADHALFRSGVTVDTTMRPVDATGTRVAANLLVAGGILAGATRWREKSGDGIAIATAVRAADTILEDQS